jgi:hypothetical protein
MTIPIIISFRGVILVSIIGLASAIFIILNNSKDKVEYDKSIGAIEYLDIEYQNLPSRNKGAYRYLKIDSYPYLFEIYEPNSKPSDKTIDDLKVGDIIEIYYYEIPETRNIGLNRFTQFIDSNGQSYFIRNGFQEQIGYALIVLCVLITLMALVFWKKGKLNW